MKSYTIILIILFIASMDSFSQNIGKGIEVSASFTFESDIQKINGSYSIKKTDLISFVRCGFNIYDNFNFEPEIQLSTVGNMFHVESNFIGNLVYNFNYLHSNFQPFVLMGYGFSNSIPFQNGLYFYDSNSFNIGNLNLGFGLKSFVSDNIAIRVEYRYQLYSKVKIKVYGYHEYEPYSLIELKPESHKILVGFSYLL